MSELQRWHADDPAVMEKAPDGFWVLYEDTARLRRIEAAARELIARHDDEYPDADGRVGDDVEALRAALEGK